VLSIRHSLHRKVKDAKGFYAVYCGLIAIAAGLVLTPNASLGLLTNAVQTLAGVLLPSATFFLLLLCNDKEVVGPWANTRGLNLFTGADRGSGDAGGDLDSIGTVPRQDERDGDPSNTG